MGIVRCEGKYGTHLLELLRFCWTRVMGMRVEFIYGLFPLFVLFCTYETFDKIVWGYSSNVKFVRKHSFKTVV